MRSKIQRTSLQSEIIRYIQNYIEDNGLKAGDKLPSQEQLIEMMGVQQTAEDKKFHYTIYRLSHNKVMYLRPPISASCSQSTPAIAA